MDYQQYKKNSTKIFLAESLRHLMKTQPFHAITIKKICDEAGVVRVTFYNYFIDKYDALGYLIYLDLIEGFVMEKDAVVSQALLEHVVKAIEENREFYEAAVQVEGQNGFEDIMTENLGKLLKQQLDCRRKAETKEKIISNQALSRYFATAIFWALKIWLKEDRQLSSEEFLKRAELLLQLRVDDFF